MLTATPFLWLQHPVDDAVAFYTRIFDGDILSEDYGRQTQYATIRILGQTLNLFNGGAYEDLTSAFSVMVTCSSQDEIDRLWDGLCEGGSPMQCGWVTDRFGVTWQIIPDGLQEWLNDPERGADVTARMLEMVKLEIAPLEAALRGD